MRPRLMSLTAWGYPGSAFDASDKPQLWEFIRTRLGLTADQRTPAADPQAIAVPASRLDAAAIAALQAAVGVEQLALDRDTRLGHSLGKSYRDLLRARRGEVGRVPDAVAFPGTQDEVERLVAVARIHRLVLVPFGGGTNIVGGVEPSPAWRGPVLTVSLRRMNRLLELDAGSRLATIEAGALGPELEAALNAQGFTLGHFPDSFEYSTLGGWLATRSAGMQSDARGKIEDMVVGVRIVTPAGTIETRPVPRAAAGPDLNQLIVGSEGIFGLITSATMRIHPLQPRALRGLLWPDFRTGFEFMRQCRHAGIAPATLRLSNAEETALSFTLKSPRGALDRALARGVKAYLQRVRGFNFENVCLMIVGWEGPPAAIERERARTLALARAHGAFDAGAGAGDSWFARKYEYPLLRDLVMDIGGLADVTETAVRWRDALATYDRVHAALRSAVACGDTPGYVGCHLAHVYDEGVGLYFTFAAPREAGRELEQYLAIKRAAMDAVVESGAALSHHHAVGYEHLPWMLRAVGRTGLDAWRGAKAALDPENLCNPGKLLPGPDSALANYWPEPRPGDPPRSP